MDVTDSKQTISKKNRSRFWHSPPVRLIAHIDADAFFASVEQGFNPLLRGKPVIVGGSENQRGVVHTASYEARARGIKTGMPLVQAKSMCPEATFLKGNYQHYQAASRIMQEVYLGYTPLVEFTSLDDAYLDLTGTMHLHPTPEELAQQIQQKIENIIHIGVSVGIATNKIIARIASGLKKPQGIVYVPPGSEKDFLAPLAVEELTGIGRAAKQKLSDLGIFTIGQLAVFPKIVLNEIFGLNGQKMWDFANGYDPREIHPRYLPKQISRETTFEEDTLERKVVLATLQYLTERIGGKLREQELLCRKVGVKIRYSDFTQHNISQTLPQATDSASDIFLEIEKSVEGLPFRRLRIRHVGVWVTQIEWRNFQLKLFDEPKRLEMLDAAVDEIREKFGFMAILPAETLELQRKYRMEKNGYVLHSPALTK
jgi:DNA polymerase-4